MKSENGLCSFQEIIYDDLHQLETVGFQVEDASIGPIQIFAILSQFTADNLALNQMFGLVESFSYDLFCQICYTTREDMQNYRREENFILRTPLEYLVDVRNLAEFFEKLCWYICPSKKFCFLAPCKMPTWARSLSLSTRTSNLKYSLR